MESEIAPGKSWSESFCSLIRKPQKPPMSSESLKVSRQPPWLESFINEKPSQTIIFNEKTRGVDGMSTISSNSFTNRESSQIFLRSRQNQDRNIFLKDKPATILLLNDFRIFFLSPFTLIPTERQEAFTLKAFKSSNNSSFHTSFQNLKPLVRQWKYFWITNHNFVIKQLGASTLKRKIELNSCSWWVYLDKIISDFALFIEIVLRKWKDLRVKEF